MQISEALRLATVTDYTPTPHEMAEAASVLAAEYEHLRDAGDHFEKFAGFVATTRRENTYEWMCLLLDWLNGVCARLDPEVWFDLVGSDHFVLRRMEGRNATTAQSRRRKHPRP